jgi:hypothetical protein
LLKTTPVLFCAALALCAASVRAQRETSLCDFEPGATDAYAVVGPSRLEDAPARVRSGKTSLRVVCGPPDKSPGLRLPGSLVRGKGFRKVRLDVHHEGTAPAHLDVRVDGEGAASHRRTYDAAPGWSTLEIDLDRMETGRGGKVDPARVVLLSFTVEKPTEAVAFTFDAFRGVEDGGGTTPLDPARAAVVRFEALFPAERDETLREGLVAGLAGADVPERVAALDRLVLATDDRPRHVDAALRVLADATDPRSVAAAIDLAERAAGPRKLRWIEAVGSMAAPAAEEYVRRLLVKPPGPETVAALAARIRRPSPALLPALTFDQGGPWQLEAVRVAGLRALGADVGFRPLVDFLRSDHARVRADAHDALRALTGRDLGEAPAAWHAWRDAASSRPALADERGRYGYGTYYGIPLSPGRVCFVLDVSGSMHAPLEGPSAAYAAKEGRCKGIKVPTRLDLARQELAAAVQGLPARATFRLVFFNAGVAEWADGPVEATKENKAKAVKYLQRLGSSGSTNLHGGLLAALDAAADPREAFRRSVDAVYLLTDGQPTAGRVVDPAELVADVVDRNRGRFVAVHTIGLGEADCALLRDLSRRTGGAFVDLAK